MEDIYHSHDHCSIGIEEGCMDWFEDLCCLADLLHRVTRPWNSEKCRELDDEEYVRLAGKVEAAHDILKTVLQELKL